MARSMGMLTLDQVVARARSAVGHKIVYELGKGGRDPFAALPGQPRTCDCSGFVAWALGVDRFLENAGVPHIEGKEWMETTNLVDDARRRGLGYADEVRWQDALPGHILVWPDRVIGQDPTTKKDIKRQGHVGIIGSLGQLGPHTVIHCSSTNWREYGDAIRETSVDVFLRNRAIVARVAWAA